jgi:hypothetical protein
VSDFDYLIFVNKAKEPISGFAFKDDAIAWVKAKRWGRRWEIEVRKAGERLIVFTCDVRGAVADKEED